MVKLVYFGPLTRRRTVYNEKRKLKRQIASGVVTTTTDPPQRKSRREKQNEYRRKSRAEARKVALTSEQLEFKTLLNKSLRAKYLASGSTIEDRRRIRSDEQKLRRQLRRKYVTLEKCVAAMQQVIAHMETDENKNYVLNSKLRKLLCTPEKDIIEYLVGSKCNMNRSSIEEMDSIERLAMFIQLDRINELFISAHGKAGKRLSPVNLNAHIIQHFHAITQSFSDSAIDKALEAFTKKAFRDESGACSKLSLTVALHEQSYMSCNKTGFQSFADSINRNDASGEGIMPSRNTLQQCGDQIATGTKTIVPPTIDDDYRVYRVDFGDELNSITKLGFIEQEQKLSKDLVKRYIDDSYVCNLVWKGRVMRIGTNNVELIAEIKLKENDLNLSCDGYKMASSSNGCVGIIMTFKGKETLCKLTPDYDKLKDNPEFGDRAGFNLILNVLNKWKSFLS